MTAFKEFNAGLDGKLNEAIIKSSASKGDIDAFNKAAATLQEVKSVNPSLVNDRIGKVYAKADTALSNAQGAFNANKTALESAEKALKELQSPKDAKAAAPSAETLTAAQTKVAEATKALDKASSKLNAAQNKVSRVEKISDQFNRGAIELKADTKKPSTKIGQHPKIAQQYSVATEQFGKIIDPEAIAKNAKEQAAGKTATAAKTDGWVSKLKSASISEAWNGSSTGVKFGRVAGTGAGLVMVYDGLTRSKAGDQDRSTIARLAEVAAGVGIAGASLAYRR